MMRGFAAGAGLIGLPLLTVYFWMALRWYDGSLVAPFADGPLVLIERFPAPTFAAAGAYTAWLALQTVLYVLLPGRTVEGTPLSDGTRLQYRLNGWSAFCGTCTIVVLAVWSGLVPRAFAYDAFGALLVTACTAAFLIAAAVYVVSRRHAAQPRGPSAVYDYFMGVTLNPRVRDFDLKFFCESRPGLMLWLAINASFAAKEYELTGTVSTAMLLVNAFQFVYVADYFFHEEAILTTWDIRHERFGWMLCWGSMVWVPFTYSLQAHYLVTHDPALTPLAVAGLIALNAAGYAIFRSANLQKHRFRRDPGRRVWGRTPVSIPTAAGSLLLTSGWWGIARHANYLGDLLMGMAWCLTTGFGRVLPYFYAVYFAILLVHRERRDHARCLRKYGRDWERYCETVRWRIVPGLY